MKYRNGLLTLSFSPRSFNFLKIFIPFCFIVATGRYLFRGDSLSNQVTYLYGVAVSGERSVFIKQALDNEFDGPFDNRWLSKKCSSRDWTPGLIVKCGVPYGGVGNVRNVILNCIRYAIEAGGWYSPHRITRELMIRYLATAFIVPEIMARGTKLTQLKTNDIRPLGYFFDVPFFTSSLSEACPQMTIIPHINDLWELPTTAKHIPFVPVSKKFVPEAPRVLATPGYWLQDFRSFINKVAPEISAARPVVIDMGTPMFQFPLSYDDPNFVASFGKILRFREDSRRLASTVLYALSSKYELNLDPSSKGVSVGKFYGAHLRTAADAAAGRWTPYFVQSRNYISAAATQNLSVIYLASGNPKDVIVFTETAANRSISVSTKQDLLSEPEYSAQLAEMESLTWDQQALIDFEVLLRCALLGGTWESSFAWNIALRRHVVVGGGTWYGKGQAISSTLPSVSPRSLTSSITPTPPLVDHTPIETSVRSSLLPRDDNHNAKSPHPHPTTPSKSTKPKSKGEMTPLEKSKVKVKAPQSFQDAASVIFGRQNRGNYFELSMWP